MFKGHFYQLKPGGWIVSDTHFGHKNIIKYSRPEYLIEDEGYMLLDVISKESVEKMHEAMIKEGNSVVNPEDKVIHLGDVALGMEKEELTKIIGRLNGTKMLLPGNHDRALIKKHRHYFNDVGFKNVEVGINKIEIEAMMPFTHPDGRTIECVQQVTLSHEPLEHIPNGTINIHGHVHDGITQELYAMDTRRINVCGDAIKEGV